MVNYIRTFVIVLIGSIALAMNYNYALSFSKDANATSTLQNSLQVSTLSSNDKSARVNKGSYVIDLQKFQETLGETKVKEFDGKNPHYRIEILKDDNSNIHDNGDTYQSLYDTSIESANNKSHWNFGDRGQRYVAVKSIRVIANFEVSQHIKNKIKNSDEHVATYVVQNTTASNDENDLTA